MKLERRYEKRYKKQQFIPRIRKVYDQMMYFRKQNEQLEQKKNDLQRNVSRRERSTERLLDRISLDKNRYVEKEKERDEIKIVEAEELNVLILKEKEDIGLDVDISNQEMENDLLKNKLNIINSRRLS
jgi:hypothetical protein